LDYKRKNATKKRNEGKEKTMSNAQNKKAIKKRKFFSWKYL